MPAVKSAATVNLTQLAAPLAEHHKLTKKEAEQFLHDLVGLLQTKLKNGNRVRMSGFGIFQVRQRGARMGRNPKTGEPIHINASKKVTFRAAKELKESV